MALKSIAQLLVELKTLDKRIIRAIDETGLVTMSSGNKMPAGVPNKEKFGENAKAALQSVISLMENRDKAKAAIVCSNAVTKVVVGNTTMTVAEAIERKASIHYRKQLLAHLVDQFRQAEDVVNRGNRQVQERLDQMLLASRGKEGRVDASADEAFTKSFLENNQFEMVDPCNLKDVINALQVDIEDFESNVDLALSTSNAITQVEV